MSATLRLSKSSLGMYLHCPLSYYFGHIAHLPQRTDYHRLLGTTVHQFIAGLYRRHLDRGRPFFYSDLNKVRAAWFYTWSKAVQDSRGQIRFPDEQTAADCGVTGWVCVKQYWEANESKPTPLYVEKRLEFPVLTGVRFVGVFDQIRAASVDSIRSFRPDLLVGDGLLEGYASVFIIDLKTNWGDFDLAGRKPDASLEEQAAYQFELHQDLQVTAYHWLYYQNFHRLPVGFFWYHLRSGKWFFTYRTLADFDTFLGQVQYVVDGLNAEQFPPVVTASCRYCDYCDACATYQGDRPAQVSQPAVGMEEGSFGQLALPVAIPRMVQSKLKLVFARTRRKQ